MKMGIVLHLLHCERDNGSPGTDGHGDLVVEQVDDEVEADRLLPVDVRVSDGELLAVPPPHLHQVTLAGAQLPEHQSHISIM